MRLKRARDQWFIVGVLITACSVFPVNSQPQISLTPKYVPPACQGKLTTVPRAEMESQPTPSIKANPPINSTDQLVVFNGVAKAIWDDYVYTDFNGQNWLTVVSEYRAKIERGLDTETFYAEMVNFVKRLGDDHSSFSPPVQVAAEKAALAGKNDYVGIGALFKPMVEKHRISILSVFPDSPAEKNGLRAHDILLAVDGYPIIENNLVQQWRVRGPECSLTVLRVETPGRQPRDVALVRFNISAPLPIFARRVATRDGSRIGYVFVPSFFDLTIPDQVRKALAEFGDLDGLIIDDRMNGGGSSKVLEPMLGLFTSGTVGHYLSRAGRRPLTITSGPAGNSQDVRLVVLVSRDTISYGEVFAGVLQDIGRAKIVGQTTRGNVETLHGYSFKDGSRAWIATESFEPLRSRLGWEKRGVKPDVEVYADWDTFTFENDPAVAASLKLLAKR